MLTTQGVGTAVLPVGAWVERRRLLDELHASGPATVVTVSGPAGSGKSTLARQWVHLDCRRSAVIRLAAHDDAVSLAEGLIGALESFDPDAPGSRAPVTATEPAFSTVLLPALGSLASSRDVPYLLVVDDVHLLTGDAASRVLHAVCEAVPTGSQVALLTRGALPGWIAPMRAERRIHAIGAAALAFDVDEAARLVQGQGLDLPSAELRQLVEHSEGWAVALYLTTLAMNEATAGPGAHSPAAGADPFIVDYLRAAVLGGLDVEDVDFLRRTCILETLSAPVCDAVTGRHDSARVLPALHRRIQLVVPLDRENRRFRYHHLFQEALREELRTEDPELVAELHRRAADWYATVGDADEAVRHAKLSGDLSFTGRLVWSDIALCVGTGRPDRLHRWLLGLTDRQVATDPWLSLAAAWSAMQTGDAVRMNRWTMHCEAHAGRDWRVRVDTDEYAAELAVLTIVIGRGGLGEAIQLASAALDGLAPGSPFRSAAAFICGVALTLRREFVLGEQRLVEAGRVAAALDVPIIEADSASWLGTLALLAGDVDRAARLIDQASYQIRRHRLDRLAYSAHCVTAQGLAEAIRGDRAAAAATLSTARMMMSGVSDIAPWFHVCGRLIQARTAVLLGDGATARVLLREAQAHMTPELAASLAQDLLDDTQQALRRLDADSVPGAALTTAELRVLQFMPTHLSFPEIGEHLFLSRNTVKTHALSIYRKLGVTSRSDAVAAAQRHGLLEPGTSADRVGAGQT